MVRPQRVFVCAGFNGAAAGQPRKAAPRRVNPPKQFTLQWGRGWTAAEGETGCQSPTTPDGLQWGRGWTAAEGRIFLRPRRGAIPASMGPRLDSRGRCHQASDHARVHTASMGPRLDSRGRVSRPTNRGARDCRFNGAAAGQPRKVSPSQWESLLFGQLQWGRGWTAAEGRGLPAAASPVERASMGPRLDSRGRRACCARCGRFCPLQWGRGWTAAEGPRKQVGVPGPPPASMGPRLDSRGRAAQLVPSTYAHAGFNGAAAGQPRKALNRAQPAEHLFGLQWGRGWTAAEGWIPPATQTAA